MIMLLRVMVVVKMTTDKTAVINIILNLHILIMT